MLNDRERQCLASIENELRRSDPRLVARFRSLEAVRARRRPQTVYRSVHAAGAVPSVLLAAAMLLLLVGAISGATTVVVAGAVVAILSLGVAATSTARPGPGFA